MGKKMTGVTYDGVLVFCDECERQVRVNIKKSRLGVHDPCGDHIPPRHRDQREWCPDSERSLSNRDVLAPNNMFLSV